MKRISRKVVKRYAYWTTTGGFDAGFGTKREAEMHAAVLIAMRNKSGSDMVVVEQNLPAVLRELARIEKVNKLGK